mgnify:CR=1 FL=1
MSRNTTSGRGGQRHKSGRHSHSTSGRTARHGSQMPGHRARGAESSPLVGKTLELSIDTLALGGAGVGRMPDTLEGAPFEGAGMAVFVSGALPGSRVLARLTAVHRRHAEAVVVEVLEASPEAVTPFCPHFGVCGGCSLQHLAPASQLAWKERQILDALRRIGKVEPGKVLPAVAAPSSQRFRNKMEFAFQGKGDALRLGLYEAGTSGQMGGGRVFDLTTCPIFPEAGVEIVHAVRDACSREESVFSMVQALSVGFAGVRAVLRVFGAVLGAGGGVGEDGSWETRTRRMRCDTTAAPAAAAAHPRGSSC